MFEVLVAFAGFRGFRRFLLIPMNKAHATTASERPTATGTIGVASASERRFETGDPNEAVGEIVGEAVGEAVIKFHGQISTECQTAL